MRQGGLLFDTAMLYVGARAVRGTGSPKTFQESWQNLKSVASDSWQNVKSAAKSTKSWAKSEWNRFLTDERGSLNLGKPKYETTPNLFPGEEYGKHFGGSKVKYLKETERAERELFVKDGKLVKANGDLFDTSEASTHWSGEGKAIFVMDENGRIFASPYQEPGVFHHSSLVAGKPVASAGELVVKNGEILEISRKSGHYEPTKILNKQIILELQKRGMDTRKIKQTKGFKK